MLKRLQLTLLLAFAMGIASAGEMTLLEEAAEFESLKVRVSDTNQGQFRIRNCDNCDEVQLKVTSSTRLTVGGKRVPLAALNRFTLKDGTVFYRVESGIVTRIEAAR